MSTAESEAVLKRVIDYLQASRVIRIALGVLFVGALLGLAGRAAYQLIPRSHTLSISGGDIVDNRHYIARVVQSEGKKQNLNLIVKPTSSTLVSLERVSSGELDMAFVQGGIEKSFPNVEHVASVMPEYLHLLAKPGIKGLGDLKDHSVNLGAKNSGARQVARRIMEFATYRPDVDYVEMNYSPEDLLAIPDRKMPDAIFTVSTVPSYFVEALVNERGYKLLEIPFPQSLALRYGWAGNGKILAYTYRVDPPVPEKDISTVTINMYLVANSKVDPEAAEKVLETLFSPSTQSRLRVTLDEKAVSTPSGFPISPATGRFIKRNDSIFTLEMWNQASGIFGLIMSFGGMAIVLAKWFKGAPPKPEMHDEEFHGYLADVVGVEKKLGVLEAAASPIDRAELLAMRDSLNILRVKMLERYPQTSLKDANLFDRCMTSLSEANEHVGAALEKVVTV
jgi:TRAP-type uncharacterized transport system substrate-binding protein